MLNFRELIRPLLERLKSSGLTERQQEFLEITEAQLQDILSPFLRGVTTRSSN